ncbi:unnamed protein product [Owenia fusiformis]|uniref:Probable RNA-binding protein 18 n=1 Tax=Owenia fusiformis TaxID=6347 RepID=A0A8J1XUQ7_OWEFU|nr:unnamed protein product [Owenia fusiformis]
MSSTAASTGYSDPVPLDQIPNDGEDNRCRLWIGNMDQRITELAMLKILQKHGDVKKFDFLTHKGGPQIGKPRGYCFVTFKTIADAMKVQKALDGKMALSRKLVVRSANSSQEVPESSSSSSTVGSTNGTSSKIKDIEAKLKLMEHTQKEFTILYNPTGRIADQKSNSQSTNKNNPKPYNRNTYGTKDSRPKLKRL